MVVSSSVASFRIPFAVWESLRPRQWTKNLFVFSGLLFSQNIFDFHLALRAIFAFAVFCILSGSIYLLNDIVDLNQDRRHPVKGRRPLAAGRLSVSEATAFFVVFTVASLVASYLLGLPFFVIGLVYFLLQLAYSFSLKHIVILDVFAVALGFVLRVVAGGLVINVEISSWLLICTILLALFLALSKRRHESIELDDEAESHRKVLGEYSPYLLDQMISVVTASTVVAYALYTMSEETVRKFGTKNLVFTIPFVLYGIFRYLYLIHQKEKGGSPESIVITDRPLMVDILLWVVAAGMIIYR
jgi:4-hydroxybenzoate polyprenyltransferase